MKNITDCFIDYGGFAVGPGESVNSSDMPPKVLAWFIRHGCTDEEPTPKKTTKKVSVKRTFGG